MTNLILLLITAFIFIDVLLDSAVPNKHREKYNSTFRRYVPGAGIWMYVTYRREKKVE
jgi:hypothetical protein